MGTASHEKTSKKRKRSHTEDESLPEAELHATEHGKSAKKRKRQQNEDESILEEHVSDHVKSAKKKKSQIDDEASQEEHTNHDEKTKKKKKKKNHDEDNSILEEQTLSKKSKKKKSGMAQKEVTEPKADVDRLSNSSEDEGEGSKQHSQPKKGKKKRKESGVEEDESEKEQSHSKKERKKGKQPSSFGVVDTKLLRDHGGEDVEPKKNVKRKPNQVNRALDYLRLWKKNFKSWKFSKLYQARLIKILYEPVVTEEDFEICLQYFEKCQGKAREQLKADAMDIINEDEDESVDADKEKRARQVLHMLG